MRNETHTTKFRFAAILALACFYGNGAIHSHTRARGLSMRTHLTAVDLEATTWKRQLGSDNLEATTWKRQLGSDNLEATTWKRQLGSDNLEATTSGSDNLEKEWGGRETKMKIQKYKTAIVLPKSPAMLSVRIPQHSPPFIFNATTWKRQLVTLIGFRNTNSCI